MAGDHEGRHVGGYIFEFLSLLLFISAMYNSYPRSWDKADLIVTMATMVVLLGGRFEYKACISDALILRCSLVTVRHLAAPVGMQWCLVATYDS
eukprot:scaffold41822_cov58-Attheya_sp.AAC.4